MIQYKIAQNNKAKYVVLAYLGKTWVTVSSVEFDTYEEVLEYLNRAIK